MKGNTLTRFIGRTGLVLKKHSPIILTIAGVVGLTAAGVAACVQTTKADAIIKDHQERLSRVHEAKEISSEEEYSDTDYKSDLVKTYTRTGVEFIKLYAVPFTIAAVSITAILAGHNILEKRNAALGAAYQALSTSFAEYRKRVVEDQGKDKDIEYMTNCKLVGPKTDEDGNQVVEYQSGGGKLLSPYARIFDETNKVWTKDPVKNRCYILGQQTYLNDLLHLRGHVFLNEAYEALGFPHTPDGAVVGWYLSKDGSTDNFIDFGVSTEHDRSKIWLFENDIEPTVVLDFNVDGYILQNL